VLGNIQYEVFGEVTEKVGNRFKCRGESFHIRNITTITDSGDREGIMLQGESGESIAENMAEICTSSMNGDSARLEFLSVDAHEINLGIICDKEVDSIDISVDTMQVDEDSLEMERNLVRRRDGWSPGIHIYMYIYI
jgi:hypothetical protein